MSSKELTSLFGLNSDELTPQQMLLLGSTYMSTLNLDLPPLPETNGITKKKILDELMSDCSDESDCDVKAPSIL